MSRIPFALALVGALTLGGTLQAQPQTDNHEQAIRLFEIGQLQYEASEFSAAAQSFSRAFELESEVDEPVGLDFLALNAALSYENTGEFELSEQWFQRAIEVSTGGDAYEQATRGLSRVQVILSRIAAVSPAPSELVVATTPAGARVIIDGTEIGQTPLEWESMAGTYDLVIELDGYNSLSDTVELDEGETLRMNLSLAAVTATSVEENPVEVGVSTPAEVVRGERGSMVPTYALGSLTVAALASGVGYAMSANAWYADAELPERMRDEEAFHDSLAFASRHQDISTVSYTVAGAAAIGTLITFLTSRPKPIEDESTDALSWDVEPVIGRHARGARVRLNF